MIYTLVVILIYIGFGIYSYWGKDIMGVRNSNRKHDEDDYLAVDIPDFAMFRYPIITGSDNEIYLYRSINYLWRPMGWLKIQWKGKCILIRGDVETEITEKEGRKIIKDNDLVNDGCPIQRIQ